MMTSQEVTPAKAGVQCSRNLLEFWIGVSLRSLTSGLRRNDKQNPFE